MNCWEVLGIEPSADKKEIKIAYSKLLKITRPDDDPEGFERLHSAYKSALKAVNSSQAPLTAERSTDVLESTLVDIFDTRTEPGTVNLADNTSNADTYNASGYSGQDRFVSELENEWHSFTSLVNEIMRDQHSANLANSWKSVVNSPLLMDLQYKDRASDYVFDIISEQNTLSLNNGALYIDSSTLNHLNIYFSWGANWGQLDEKFSSSRVDAVLPFLDAEEQYEAPQEARPHINSRIVSYVTTLLAIVAGYLHYNLFVGITILAIPVTINRVYMRKWQTKNYGRVIGGEDELIEHNKYLMMPVLFIAMWILLLSYYATGWVIHYLIRLVSM